MGRRSWPAFGAALVLVAGLAGCGVSRSDTASDEGDAAVVGTAADNSELRRVPTPDSASSPEGLVREFFKAAVGGGKAGTDQVKAFLNPHALASWQEAASPDNPPMTVIRFRHPPTTNAVTGGRTPVLVEYLVIGNLTDQGQVDLLDPPVERSTTFFVVPDERNPSNLRIDEISNYLQPGLMLSDDALDDVYRVQPIYFWDTSYKSLVPDVRYVQLTEPADVRAQHMVNWLLKGLTGLETMHGVSAPQVVSDSGTLTVKFTGDGPAPDPDGLRRMLFQLQWTLRPPGSGSPNVRLVIDDKPQEVPPGPDEYQSANRSWNFRQTSPPRYDVTENKVVANPSGANPLPVLAGAENQGVVAAAVGREGAVAAFVRTEPSSRRYLQIVREGGGVLATALKGSSILRPVFVPDSNDSVLVISGGRLYAVSGTDGTVNDVTTRGSSGVTSVSVSSDGRRVAYVANGQAFVASLNVANNNIAISANPRPVLSGQIVAGSVTWLSESWIAVSGSAAGGPALWRVTADGVVAQNLSESLKDVVVEDLVAYPTYPAKTTVDVLVTTPNRGVYSLLNSLAPEPGLHAPFFGS